jgi:hypothetical protein
MPAVFYLAIERTGEMQKCTLRPVFSVPSGLPKNADLTRDPLPPKGLIGSIDLSLTGEFSQYLLAGLLLLIGVKTPSTLSSRERVSRTLLGPHQVGTNQPVKDGNELSII